MIFFTSSFESLSLASRSWDSQKCALFLSMRLENSCIFSVHRNLWKVSNSNWFTNSNAESTLEARLDALGFENTSFHFLQLFLLRLLQTTASFLWFFAFTVSTWNNFSPSADLLLQVQPRERCISGILLYRLSVGIKKNVVCCPCDRSSTGTSFLKKRSLRTVTSFRKKLIRRLPHVLSYSWKSHF